MNICELSSRYVVRKLTEKDVEQIYELSLGNPRFFQFCPPQVTRESIREDMKALPPNMSPESKYYVGFFDGDKLVAVMDLILGYPKAGAAYIGLLMVDKDEQGRGVGSGIIEGCADALRNWGCQKIALAYAKGNSQSEKFWLKNGFRHAGAEVDRGGYTAVPMEYTFRAGREDRYPRGPRLWRADR